ncbi:hypothetical protein F5B22DRAFT_626705 [Xylaria bambusicola]|uniref:uncharacterized protein n=1 Tax=Xylaria bambusicola TaxID=326684 RepID=UPI002007D5C9|nr:uncharacterized protein F5B22DRAFT_626705 [Xylaria bambusicola]KAI0505764.1 hypothetical protein F5B22DRAFT_626705 [Xylaria bambusicola]
MSETILTQRRSTGGLPPIKIIGHYIVEEAPSHDNTPCITAWVRDEIIQVPDRWEVSDFRINDKRPMWSIQIYATTPQSDNRDHLRALAETLHRETLQDRDNTAGGWYNRFDVWGMPLPVDASDEERVAKLCRRRDSL